MKKIQMSRFINTELKSDSDLDSQEESKFDSELMAKLASGPDSEEDIIGHKWLQMITNKSDSHK